MPAFSSFKGLAGRGTIQKITVGAQLDYVLLSDPAFAGLDNSKKIEVTIIGNITSSSTTTGAISIGDLSGYRKVDITINGGVVIRGKGGTGGVGQSADGSGALAGVPGGDAIFVDNSNNSTILSVTNDGTLRGAGGGGGGGGRVSHTNYSGNDKVCTQGPDVFAPSGGGGGGAGLNNGVGGAGGTGGTTQGGPGATSTADGGAAGGSFGTRSYQFPSACDSATVNGSLGGAGGASGVDGIIGPGGGGAGGARGFYIRNSGSCNFTNNGTVIGNI